MVFACCVCLVCLIVLFDFTYLCCRWFDLELLCLLVVDLLLFVFGGCGLFIDY